MPTTDQQRRAARFRELHETAPLLLPNAWDAASAVAIAAAGATAIATTSAGVAWTHGYPDGERVPVEALLRLVERIVQLVDVPVSIDIEGGYGSETADVASTVAGIVAAGAVGINLEDAPAPGGIELRSAADQADRIAAARRAAADAKVHLWINARTDTFLVGDAAVAERLEDTLARAAVYAAAGADSLFVPGVADTDVIRRLTAAALPLNVMVAPGAPSVSDLCDLGVGRISLGPAIAQATYRLAEHATHELLEDGTFNGIADAIPYATVNEMLRARA